MSVNSSLALVDVNGPVVSQTSFWDVLGGTYTLVLVLVVIAVITVITTVTLVLMTRRGKS